MPIEPISLSITIHRVAVDRIIPLRHRILRAGLPVETAHFPGDVEPATLHFAAFLTGKMAGEAIACASFMLNSLDGMPAWQLRGMATASTYQGKGIGRTMLVHAEQAISNTSEVRLYWCNARVPAVGFYEKQGWQVISEPFDIPTAGPHRRMKKALSQ